LKLDAALGAGGVLHGDGSVSELHGAAHNVEVPAPHHRVDDAAFEGQVALFAAGGELPTVSIDASFVVVLHFRFELQAGAIAESDGLQVVEPHDEAEGRYWIEPTAGISHWRLPIPAGCSARPVFCQW